MNPVHELHRTTPSTESGTVPSNRALARDANWPAALAGYTSRCVTMSTSFSDARNGRKSCNMRQSTSMYSTSSPVIKSALPARTRSSITRASGQRRRDAPLCQRARHRPIHRQDHIVVHTLPVCMRSPVGDQLAVRVIAGCEQHEVVALHALSHRHEFLIPCDGIR
eukprot:7391514-Prymnesium_polylepis.2